MRLPRGASVVIFFSILVFSGSFLLVSADPSHICLSDDNQTCLVLSPQASQELLQANNAYGDDLQARLERRPTEEKGIVLRALWISVTKASNGQPVTDFSFKTPVELQLGRWAMFQQTTPIDDLRQWVSVYWDNGQSAVRVDGLTIQSNQALSITIHAMGHYQVLAAQRASILHLSRGSPYPRTITPNGRFNRRIFFFIENPGTDSIKGTIYDFQGSKVRDIQIDGLSPAPNALVWDGRDSSGSVVPSGPYFYKLSAGGQEVSGSLVVAR